MAKFNREKDQRQALLRGLCVELFKHGEITTTTTKAKDLRPVAEKLITRAVKGGQNNRRLVTARLANNEEITTRLFETIAPSIKRESGYLTISTAGRRRGDNADMSTIGFVDEITAEETAA